MSSTADLDLTYIHALHNKFYSSQTNLNVESSSSSTSSTARPHTAQGSSPSSVQDHEAISRPLTQPISIPQPSQHQSHDQSEAVMFAPVEWRSANNKMESRERELSLKRASSAGPSQSANTKVKAQKENGIFRKTSQKHDTPQPANGPSPVLSSSSTFPAMSQPNDIYAVRSLPDPFTSGDAARRAAQASNAAAHASNSVRIPHYQQLRDSHRSSIGRLAGASDSGADLASNADLDVVDVDMVDAAEAAIISKTANKGSNPVDRLPTEIVTLIFSHLDANSLKACQGVAKSWAHLAMDRLIWRAQYLQQYEKQTYVSPAPIQIGGVGTGIANQPLQDWELMHDARRRIDKNWSRGDQGGKGVYLAGHTDSVYCVQFDEQKIITGSRDRTIRVWDINTYKCLKVIGGPSVRPVPGPKVLRTVEYPKFYHAEPSVNGTAVGNSIYHVPSDFHSASILCLQYDHEILVTGSSDNDLLVWDIKTYEPIRRLKQHTGGVLDVAFDEKHIVSCSKDCTIIVWDRKTLEPIRTLTGHRGPVNAVQLRGNLLVSASGDGVARLWDLNKMQCVREFPQKERGLAAVEFSDDAKFVLAGGNDHITYKFDVATGAEVKTFTGHTQLVRSLFLDTQNRRVVSGSYDLDLRVYDYDTGALLGRFNEWTTSWMLAAKCDYRRIVSTSQDGRILMIDFGRDINGQVMPGVELLRGVSPLSA